MALDPNINNLLMGLVSTLSSYRRITDEKLSVARAQNVNNTCTTLMGYMTDEKKDVSLDDIIGVISKGKRGNVSLSAQYGKSHVSYKDNLSIGYSKFSAWYHSDWCLSRANKKFEKCESLIELYKSKFSPLKLEPTMATMPPSSSVAGSLASFGVHASSASSASHAPTSEFKEPASTKAVSLLPAPA